MYEWVSVHEASRRLNRSVSTIRRQIESGELVGEREPLAKGSPRDRYRVRLDVPETRHEAPAPETPPSTPDAPETPQDAPGAAERALEIMDALLRANAAAMERQAETIGDLRERAGRAEAERDALRARLEAAEAERDWLRGRSLWKPWTW